jgi:hypothetical protein
MSKIKFYFILLIATVGIVSCSKDKNDEVVVTPPRDYGTQNIADKAMIEEYLQKNYITVVNHPGLTDDQDVVIAKLDATHTVSIWDQKDYTLLNRKVELHGITYILYYLVLREGKGESPTNVDGAFVAYKGNYLSSVTESTVTTITSTFFEENKFPIGVDLYNTVRGWKEIFPQLKAGTYKSNSNGDGTVVYSDFGAGVMFIPSGLGYFSAAQTGIPAYSPLVFNVKLYEINRLDHEHYYVKDPNTGRDVKVPVPDGIKSFQEDKNGDGYMWDKSELQNGVTVNPDDTDGDGIPDFLDRDDDGDDYATQGEVKDANGKIYPFDKIPDCSGNQDNAGRLKRYLDKDCHKMNQ